MGIPHIRGAARVTLTGLASLSLVTGVALASVPQAAAATQATAHTTRPNPYSPAYQHPYRHGVIPTIQQNAKMKSWASNQPAATTATGPETLSYGGGVDGIGVQSGHSKVYLVFYGSQWGTQSTNGNGDATFSGDPDGAAPVTQEMFKGIGTGNERWSADLTQWCDGPNVSAGATSCPSNANFIPYQSGGVLSGVWYDNSAASPSAATGHQLGAEAVKAAGHFGNTTAASNRDAYYVILSPHNTNPDNYQGQYCAWHDYNGDSTLTGGPVSSSYGDIAFSNQPYNMDSGSGCGVGFVNSPGTLDGWTMTLGHEWHEMMSDQNPAGGWTNQTGSSYNGQENSDECAWISPGTTGGAANVSMGTGTFAEQASWSNDTNNCAISHAIVGGGGGGTGGTLTNGTFETGSLSSWTTSGTTSATTSAAHSGSYGAMVGSTNPTNTSSVSQSFTAPSGSSKVSFWYNVTCPDTVSYDWATATLQDTTAGTTTTLLGKTCTQGAGWKQVSGTVTAGHNYTLTLTNNDDNYVGDATYTYYDDVTVS
ncbi:hypothetical protein A6P39_004660 [Streptomyces sp. FXJ1.172]|uniref:hypothetical protein n=1 Tax=Streptomyces sp. FXJ1.172 TaxID=710705 RepID=UPI00083437EE|nr:hypothetical protein [Streptomyces sp. FXJ1.172]WEO93372.1 hypothetical protein A6P39_004660 [Streptomyces sp. FXJ1.172]